MNGLTTLLLFFRLAWNLVSAALDAEGIVGGDLTNENDFKYMVSLQLNGTNFCGGCIIHDQYILTAAHCIDNNTVDFIIQNSLKFEVVAGTNNLNDQNNGVRVDVDTMYIYSGYDSKTAINDIGIIKLTKGLGLGSNPNIEKINLSQADKTYAGVVAVVSGFGLHKMFITNKTGQMEELGGNSDKKLRYADVRVLANTECAKKNFQTIHDGQICGQMVSQGKKPKGVCRYDSGSPLVYGDAVIGVVSKSPFGCRENILPATYTRVSLYLSFINSVLNGTSSNDITFVIAPFNNSP